MHFLVSNNIALDAIRKLLLFVGYRTVIHVSTLEFVLQFESSKRNLRSIEARISYRSTYAIAVVPIDRIVIKTQLDLKVRRLPPSFLKIFRICLINHQFFSWLYVTLKKYKTGFFIPIHSLFMLSDAKSTAPLW